MRAGIWLFSFVCIRGLASASAAPNLPVELEGWDDWVLHGQEFRRCPFFATSVAGEPST
jgi:hypothetical protein